MDVVKSALCATGPCPGHHDWRHYQQRPVGSSDIETSRLLHHHRGHEEWRSPSSEVYEEEMPLCQHREGHTSAGRDKPFFGDIGWIDYNKGDRPGDKRACQEIRLEHIITPTVPNDLLDEPGPQKILQHSSE